MDNLANLENGKAEEMGFMEMLAAAKAKITDRYPYAHQMNTAAGLVVRVYAKRNPRSLRMHITQNWYTVAADGTEKRISKATAKAMLAGGN